MCSNCIFRYCWIFVHCKSFIKICFQVSSARSWDFFNQSQCSWVDQNWAAAPVTAEVEGRGCYNVMFGTRGAGSVRHLLEWCDEPTVARRPPWRRHVCKCPGPETEPGCPRDRTPSPSPPLPGRRKAKTWPNLTAVLPWPIIHLEKKRADSKQRTIFHFLH